MTMNFLNIINSMSVDEMKQRLAEYMSADSRLMPSLVAVEVRLSGNNTRTRYDVLLIDELGNETPVKFRDRYSRLVYIYTLMHPKGYQRRQAAANNYHALCNLYSLLYFKDSNALLKTVESTDKDHPGHFMNQYIAQARRAVLQASPLACQFTIDRPQSHNGKVLIPFAAAGGTVILDSSLNNKMFNL